MKAGTQSIVSLDSRFARDLSEMAVRWDAAPAPDPQLIILNESLATDLGLDADALRGPEGVRLLTGDTTAASAAPVAQAYAGHQFGGYSPRLGDGRALLLGEVADRRGELRDIHLKGSGPTPFARAGDGFAALGPMLREYLVSEAMHALGIPTTRSLAVVATGRPVYRETALPGAVLTRVASSHLRVGSFEYARNTGDVDLLRRLADHAIARHDPDLATTDAPYLRFFEAVIDRQASLVARWMLVGFVHGVMNTDNMTISGETIDYGPCAFLESFDARAVFSSIDTGGRYAYGNQPHAAQWNLARLAEALLPLLADDPDEGVSLAQDALGGFATRYNRTWTGGMRAKLGLAEGVAEDDLLPLATELHGLLRDTGADYTASFRALAAHARGETDAAEALFADVERLRRWVERWSALGPDAALMDRTNPVYIPRNHLVEEALASAGAGDLAPVHDLLTAITSPFEERPGFERYAASAPPEFGAFTSYCGT
ncbi:YdiU family protein [Microbacterium sp. 179-B 1A2 NHS]|uniref:protein adenylyltransferase SelO n=1 Tax=Microbacterium sp. 179-B 1A2 NHS TaxID=3142383 RepID=UPI0039A2E984